MSFPHEIIGLVEATYRMNLGEQDWLSELARVLHPLLPDHLAAAALLIDTGSPNEPPRMHVRQSNDVGIYAGAPLPGYIPNPVSDIGRVLLGSNRCTTLSDLGSGLHAAWRATCSDSRVADLLLFSVDDGSSYGIHFVVALEHRARTPERLERLWEKVASHLGAAARIRKGLAHLCRDQEQNWEPSEYAGRLALRVLCERATQAAVAHLTSEEHRLLETRTLWQQMTSGAYSMIDHVDVGTRHYVVMARNLPGLVDPRALTDREMEVLRYSADGGPDRLIARRLGVSNSTVATHRSRAMEKLGIRSRALLAQMLKQLGVAVYLGETPYARGTRHPAAQAARVRVGSEELIILSFSSLRCALPGALTHAERRVATLLLEGLSNQEIARLRGTSVRTVANQAAAIFKKLGVRRRAQLGDGLTAPPLSMSA